MCPRNGRDDKAAFYNVERPHRSITKLFKMSPEQEQKSNGPHTKDWLPTQWQREPPKFLHIFRNFLDADLG
jgi:hypothetical protein